MTQEPLLVVDDLTVSFQMQALQKTVVHNP